MKTNGIVHDGGKEFRDKTYCNRRRVKNVVLFCRLNNESKRSVGRCTHTAMSRVNDCY